MEPSGLNLMFRYRRRALQEGLHIAYLLSSNREKLFKQAHGPPSPISQERKTLETADCIEKGFARPSDASLNPGDLCSNCEAIGIISYLTRQWPCTEKSELSIGTLLDIILKTGCIFCDFLKKIIRDQYSAHLDEAFWKHCVIKGSPVECTLEELSIQPSPFPIVRDDLRRFAFFVKLECHPLMSELCRNTVAVSNPTFHTLLDPVNASGNLFHARRVPTQVGHDLTRKWLGICEVRHPYLPYRIPNLRVIDLKSNCLVIPDLPVRYVTLTYVWGKAQMLKLSQSNSKDLHAPDGLSVHTDGFPWTIKDAMTLTRAMHERYLWIDALCITQDDENEKQTQILRMDRIYQNSILTIVACHGRDADSGLPGVRPNTRNPAQHSAEVRGQRLISHDVDKWWRDQDGSTWNTRGWTYQEYLCSNRLLTIGKSQMHFECKGRCVFCEDIAAEVDVIKPSLLVIPSPQQTNFFPRPLWDTLTNSFYAYTTAVSQYSRRAITDPHDVVKAVTGILNRWQQHYAHRGFVCGLPAGMMDAALLWHCKGSYRRRRDLRTNRTLGWPSWSWAAWEGEIEFPRSRNPHDSLLSMITWDVSTERYEEWNKIIGPEVPAMADGFPQNWKRLVTIQPITDSLTIEYLDTALPTDQIKFAFPSRRNDEAKTLCGSTQQNGVLRFRAKCGDFSLTTEDLLAPPNSTVPPRGTGILTVLDKDGAVAGAVQIPPVWMDSMIKGLQEFIVLSRTTLTQGSDDPSWDETSQTFLVEQPEDREQVRHPGQFAQRLQRQLHGLEEPTVYTTFWKLFDRRKYSALKFWPLYNVLLIQRKGDYAYRIGMGQIHVDAFDAIAEEKLVLLS